jgi:peptide/nickel transport system substrate-binding protein
MSDLENPKSIWTAGAIARRDFLGRVVALGASTALASGLLPASSVADTPKRGGHLKVGLSASSETDSLDPATFNTVFMQITGQQFYNQLVEVDEKLGLVPVLAESWDVKPGAKEWIFKIRRAVTFSNGRDMTAADVVYSLNHHRGSDSKSPAKVLLAPITELKASDTHEVTITLDSGNADLPYLLTSYLLCIGPDGGTFKDGVGTGSFVMEHFDPGIRLLSKRNPNNWRTDRGFVDSVETISMGDPTARLNAVVTGSVHLINRVDARVAHMLENSVTTNLHSISGAGHDTFPMRCDIPPFNNLNLRLAMKYAIDRESMVRRVLSGYGKIGNDIPIPSFDPMFASDIPQRPYDPDKARYYFGKAGHGAPIVLSVSDEAFSGAVDAAQIFQAGAQKAGIAMQVHREPAATYCDDVWLK